MPRRRRWRWSRSSISRCRRRSRTASPRYHVAGDRAALAALAASTVRWTFWPSLLAIALILALGKPILWLFGPSFDDGYPLMFILAIALVARAAVGPAERVLNMLGEQRRCALVYAAMFALNLGGCLAVAGPYGGMGVAIVIATALVVESALLFLIAKRRLGLHMLIWRPRNGTPSGAANSPSSAPCGPSTRSPGSA